MDRTEREGIFTGSGGVKLHYRGHRMESAPFRAVLGLVEAPAEEDGLYSAMVHRLNPSGYVLYACAHHALRCSPSSVQFPVEWNELREEVGAFVRTIREHEPDGPLFLLGAGMAGQLVMSYAFHHPDGLTGVIALNPRFDTPPERRSLVTLTRALSRIWPAFAPSTAGAPPAEPAGGLPRGMSGAVPLTPPQAVHELTSTDLTVPALILAAEQPAAPPGGPPAGGAAAVGATHLTEMEAWLDRALRSAPDRDSA